MLARTLAWSAAWVIGLLLVIDLGRDTCPLMIGG